MEAPTPKRVVCDDCPDRPEFYGKEYHAIMGHKEAATLLEDEPNGAFLIRKGNEINDFYTLTWRWVFFLILSSAEYIYVLCAFLDQLPKSRPKSSLAGTLLTRY